MQIRQTKSITAAFSCFIRLIDKQLINNLTVVGLICVFAGSLQAAKRSNPEPPQFLYHWTSYENLAKIASDKAPKDSWDTYLSKGANLFTKNYGGAENQLFAWTNPITGMMASNSEKYGDALVQFKIKTDSARVLVIDTKKTKTKTFDFSKFDLVLYKNAKYQEWIILNPKVVDTFTADPEVLKEQLKDWIEKLEDDSFKFSDEELHSKVFNDRDPGKRAQARAYAKVVVNDFLTNRSLVPSYFLRAKNGQVSLQDWKTGAQVLSAIKTWRNDPSKSDNWFRSNEYRSKVLHFDRIYSYSDGSANGSLKDLLNEVEYRTNVSTQFKLFDEIADVIAEIEKSIPSIALRKQQQELTALRSDWLNGKIDTSVLIGKAATIAVSKTGEELSEVPLKHAINKFVLLKVSNSYDQHCSDLFKAAH